MRRGTTLLLVACLGMLEAPAGAAAPKLQKFAEVERGFWLRSTFGISLSLLNHFGGSGQESSLWPPGAVMTLEAGVDFGQVASLHLALQGQQVLGSRDLSGHGSVPNDTDVIGIMLGGRFNLVTGKRLAWFIKAQVGYMFGMPEVASLGDGLAFQGGSGLEYATSLRHFFIGLEVLAEYMMSHGGLGLLVTPTVKYVF